MKIYVLRPYHPNQMPEYDVVNGFVVRAEDEAQARRMASEQAVSEGPRVWLDPLATSCDELTAEGPAEVILRDRS